MDPRDLAPDDVLLNHIFPNQPHVSIDTIFVQTWDKCVFKASFTDACKPDTSKPPSSYLVRLEVAFGDEEAIRFATVSAMQQIASFAIHKLIPKTYETDVANNAQDKRVYFSLTEFVEGETLEDVWEQMSHENQRSVVTDLVEALRKLHSFRIRDFLDRIQYFFGQNVLLRDPGTPGEHILGGAEVMGGPSTGFFAPKDGPSLLCAIANRWELSGRPFHTMTTTDAGDIIIQSEYQDFASVKVEKSSMEEWYREAVLCHNDLTPSNIIVSRPRESASASTSLHGASDYKLSAIIDWELSGFYPASYELSLQDTYLGRGYRLNSFYSLLKSQMKDIVPRSPSQVSLLQAMGLIFESSQRRLVEGVNVGALVREGFMQRLQLRRDEDPYLGWVPKDEEAAQLVLSPADYQGLEDDAFAKMKAARQTKRCESSLLT
ncbi:hypothetical protein COL5a_007050 [Colletotrichum fioriniae]|nr:hypothetical protein COL5a_007050 [Colletotrichum fioriniae]